jgi:hypothetical protein
MSENRAAAAEAGGSLCPAIPDSFEPVHPRMDRQPRAHLRGRRAPLAGIATVIALALGGCASDASNQQAIGTPSIVTGQQVITSCFQNYFYNGILPKSAAQTNCSSCVEQKLRKLGVRPGPGENEVDLLTGVRLSSSDINVLQNDCNESDASEQ